MNIERWMLGAVLLAVVIAPAAASAQNIPVTKRDTVIVTRVRVDTLRVVQVRVDTIRVRDTVVLSRVDSVFVMVNPGIPVPSYEYEQPQFDQGIVQITTSDTSVYSVKRDDKVIPPTTTRVNQPYKSTNRYVVYSSDDAPICSGNVTINVKYEAVCLICDVRTKQFKRVVCS